MPGAFNFDTTVSSQPLHADVFRPPPSPPPSNYNLSKSTGSLLSDISMPNAPQYTGTAKRKRAYTRDSILGGWGTDEKRDGESRYTLAGQIGTTPTDVPAGAGSGLDDSVYSDVNYRRALGPKEPHGAESPTSTTCEANPTALSFAPWKLFSLQTIGEVMGKVWEFCKNGAFRGFHAGGGTGYNINGSTVTEATGKPLSSELDTQVQSIAETPTAQQTPAYVPDGTEPSFASYPEPISPEPTPTHAVKRRQVSANNDELRNWVVVDEPAQQKARSFGAEVKATASRTSGLVRPRMGYYSQTSLSSHRRINLSSPRYAGVTSGLPRPVSRPSTAISYVNTPTLPPREPASYANPRLSPTSRTTSTPSRIPVPVNTSPQQSHSPTFSNSTPTATTGFRSSVSRPSSRQSVRPTSRQSVRHSLGATGLLRPVSPTKIGHHRRNQTSISSPSSFLKSSTSSNRRHSGFLAGPPSSFAIGHSADDDDDETMDLSFDAALNIERSQRLDPEAIALAQERLAVERDVDSKVDEFNQMLLNMIRQGREALGTKVEVEFLDDDDKWVDDE